MERFADHSMRNNIRTIADIHITLETDAGGKLGPSFPIKNIFSLRN